MNRTVTMGFVLLLALITLHKTKGICPTGKFGIDCRYSCNCPGGCDEVTGECSGFCSTSWFHGYGTPCQINNIAYDQPTQQSSTFQGYYSNKAVDGNRNQNLYRSSCSHTNVKNSIAWWNVDIHPPTRISQVTIYYRAETTYRFRRFTLQLKGIDDVWRDCYHHQSDSIPSIVTLNCSISTKTKILQVYNARRTTETPAVRYGNDAFLELCEVEVYVCSNGTFGEKCNRFCHCRDGPCDFVTGQCPGSGLCEIGFTDPNCETVCSKSGKYGMNCSKSCDKRHCANRQTCHHASGLCLDKCQDGWTGLECDRHCDQGFYGKKCNMSCGNCTDVSQCDHVTGFCLSGCLPGWAGDLCKQDCASLSRYGTKCSNSCDGRHCEGQQMCDPFDGVCQTGCLPGWTADDCTQKCPNGTYGKECKEQCGYCQYGTCDHVTGLCPHGCADSFQGPFCTGKCTNGTYGKDCKEQSGMCDFVTGKCPKGCTVGFQHPFCAEKCHNGTYGKDCKEQCGYCDYGTCDHVTGECPNGCIDGFLGRFCTEKCPSGTYGKDCKETCGYCQSVTCDSVTGKCPIACADGFKGPFCTERIVMSSSGLEVEAISGIAASILIAIIVCVILGVFLMRRRRHRAEAKANSTKEIVLQLHEDVENKEQKKHVNNAYSNAGFDKDDVEADTSTYTVIEDSHQETYYNVNFSPVATGIAIEELGAFVAKTAEEDFLKEYNELPEGFTTTYEESQKPENRPKNKFQGYYPYDHNRVVLKLISGNPCSDYINASFISGCTREKRYIAAQAPKDITLLDFWRMIWQENCHTVVMLTNLVEMGKAKCQQYWPETIKEYGDMKVTLEEQIQKTFYTIRILKTINKKTNEARSIKQFHFTSWPDHGTPDAMNLIEFMWQVKSWDKSKSGPILVHCSAGIGRTGSYISVDTLTDEGQKTGMVDVKRYVAQLRGERKNMIQTVEQYSFIYEALHEAFFYGNTSTTLQLLRDTYTPDSFRIGSKSLEEMCQTLAEIAKEYGKEECYNVYVHGSSKPCNAIQTPSQQRLSGVIVYCESLDDAGLNDETIWNILFDHHCSVVIHLAASIKDGFPLPCKKTKNFEFTEPSTEDVSDELSVTKCQIKKKSECRDIQLCSLYNWSGHIPNCEVSSVISVMDRARKDQLVSQHPVLILHSGSCTDPGLFCILFNVLQGIAITGDVEVINNTRRILKHLPQSSVSQEIIKYCYSVALYTDETDSLYVNI